MINPSSKLTRMRLELEEYDFTVEFLKGKDNYVADALSKITIKFLQNITGNIMKVTTRFLLRIPKVTLVHIHIGYVWEGDEQWKSQRETKLSHLFVLPLCLRTFLFPFCMHMRNLITCLQTTRACGCVK